MALNWDRPFFRSLDDLPIPYHHLLPLDKYRMPMIKGPYTFIVTSRGCPAGCKYCIKHVSYQNSVRLRSPAKLIEEMWMLRDLGIHHIHMYADLFTVNRDQVIELCNLILKEGLKITWMCNSRVDYVDEEMLRLMGRAGCTLISWGIESGNELILKRAHKGYKMEQAHRALRWAKQAGIKNWGYFIIGLPGETVESIQETMAISKKLPLDIALFHVAAPYPDTPFFFKRSGGEWLVPPGDQLGRGGYGPGHRAGLRKPQGRRSALLAEARLPRMGLPARPGADHAQVHEHLGRLQERARHRPADAGVGQKLACPSRPRPKQVPCRKHIRVIESNRRRLAGAGSVCGLAAREP